MNVLSLLCRGLLADFVSLPVVVGWPTAARTGSDSFVSSLRLSL